MILTPKNLAEAPHQIRIDTVDRAGDQYFCVTIAAKDTKVPLEVEWGYLAVYDGDKSVAGCRVHEVRELDGIVGYVDARTGRLVFLWSPPES